MSGNVHVMDHPLVAHKLTILRDKHTSTKDFRELVSEIGMLITYEATADLPLTTREVETPLCRTHRPHPEGQEVRRGAHSPGGPGIGGTACCGWCPPPRVGHIGMFRDAGDPGAPRLFLQAAPGTSRTGTC